MFYTIARFILLLFFRMYFRLKVFGMNYFPKEGALIVASNHASFLDPIIVGIVATRRLNFIARDSLFRFKPFATVLHLVNTFPMNRENSDIKAFRRALDILKKGDILFIFPEGTRSKDGNLQKPKEGIGLLESASLAPILPCYIKGSIDALPRHSILPRFKPISVYFGRPLEFSSKFSGDRKKHYMYIAEEVMKAIAELKRISIQGSGDMVQF